MEGHLVLLSMELSLHLFLLYDAVVLIAYFYAFSSIWLGEREL